jgi:phosphoglycerate dehydrogenase-like enzyme
MTPRTGTPAPTSNSQTIWCNAKFTAQATLLLRDGVARAGHRLVESSTPPTGNLASGGADPDLEGADIALGQPDPQQVMRLPRLKWVHLTSAGYTRYDRDDLKAAFRARGAALTNSSMVYAEPCAQHALAMLLGVARRLPHCVVDQQTARSWHAAEHRIRSHVLGPGGTVLIVGYGAIGRRLVELLRPFGMNVICVRRRPTGDEGSDVKVVPDSEIERVLPLADYVVNILPENPDTVGFFNDTRLWGIQSQAVFINIGRGTTVDQRALLRALRKNHLAAAYLDVTDPEPLPPEHPLWTAPNCFITPHTAGGREDEFDRLVQHFLDNLHRLDRGEPLVDRIV